MILAAAPVSVGSCCVHCVWPLVDADSGAPRPPGAAHPQRAPAPPTYLPIRGGSRFAPQTLCAAVVCWKTFILFAIDSLWFCVVVDVHVAIDVDVLMLVGASVHTRAMLCQSWS